uniref:Uncharacterized protein n=1 Tax=Aegilops tauschii subsp. strangulata TaxID=200361 RepID=A0A453MYB2_AEGTS
WASNLTRSLSFLFSSVRPTCSLSPPHPTRTSKRGGRDDGELRPPPPPDVGAAARRRRPARR